jgi:hypothetical protein
VCTALRASLYAHQLKVYSSCQDHHPDPFITKHLFSILYEAMVHEDGVTFDTLGIYYDCKQNNVPVQLLYLLLGCGL